MTDEQCYDIIRSASCDGAKMYIQSTGQEPALYEAVIAEASHRAVVEGLELIRCGALGQTFDALTAWATRIGKWRCIDVLRDQQRAKSAGKEGLPLGIPFEGSPDIDQKSTPREIESGTQSAWQTSIILESLDDLLTRLEQQILFRDAALDGSHPPPSPTNLERGILADSIAERCTEKCEKCEESTRIEIYRRLELTWSEIGARYNPAKLGNTIEVRRKRFEMDGHLSRAKRMAAKAFTDELITQPMEAEELPDVRTFLEPYRDRITSGLRQYTDWVYEKVFEDFSNLVTNVDRRLPQLLQRLDQLTPRKYEQKTRSLRSCLLLDSDEELPSASRIGGLTKDHLLQELSHAQCLLSCPPPDLQTYLHSIGRAKLRLGAIIELCKELHV